MTLSILRLTGLLVPVFQTKVTACWEILQLVLHVDVYHRAKDILQCFLENPELLPQSRLRILYTVSPYYHSPQSVEYTIISWYIIAKLPECYALSQSFQASADTSPWNRSWPLPPPSHSPFTVVVALKSHFRLRNLSLNCASNTPPDKLEWGVVCVTKMAEWSEGPQLKQNLLRPYFVLGILWTPLQVY